MIKATSSGQSFTHGEFTISRTPPKVSLNRRETQTISVTLPTLRQNGTRKSHLCRCKFTAHVQRRHAGHFIQLIADLQIIFYQFISIRDKNPVYRILSDGIKTIESIGAGFVVIYSLSKATMYYLPQKLKWTFSISINSEQNHRIKFDR